MRYINLRLTYLLTCFKECWKSVRIWPSCGTGPHIAPRTQISVQVLSYELQRVHKTAPSWPRPPLRTYVPTNTLPRLIRKDNEDGAW